MTFERVQCPFCRRFGYTKEGLKAHLLEADCQPFNELPLYTWPIRGIHPLPEDGL
jgi:hypothetical protein